MWCALGKVEFGLLRTVRCPEDRARVMCQMYGWIVLGRDSEFPVAPSHWPPLHPQSGPLRVSEPADEGE